MGRPAIEITEEICKKAESLAAQGMTMDQIALSLGMGERTLYEKKAEYPHFSQSIKEGQAKGIATITNSLFNKAKNGDNISSIFYLKNRAGWADKTEVTGKDGAPLAIIERHIVGAAK